VSNRNFNIPVRKHNSMHFESHGWVDNSMSISLEDLIAELEDAAEEQSATIAQQAAIIAQQARRIAELEAAAGGGAGGRTSAAAPAAAAAAAAAAGAMPAPADLTAWVNPAGGTAAAAGEFKMDFEGKREIVDAARCGTLLATARQGGRVDFTSVSLANKSYTAAGAAALAAVLRGFAATEVADLADIIAGRMEAEALVVLQTLCDALGHLDLREVDLSDNALGEKGVRCCEAILRDKRCLEALWFNNNGISAECAAVIVEIVTSTCPTKLKLFHFHNNMSGPAGAASLATIVRCSPELRDLRFSGTRCLTAGSLAMAEGVAALVAQQVGAGPGHGLFVSLDLADNCFGEEGSALLARAIGAGQPALRVLVLRDAGLGNGGAAAVCDALAGTAQGLATLELSGNEITEGGMGAVAACAAAKAQLVTLGLEENEMGSAGACVLAAALASAPTAPATTLAHLSLGSNEMGSGGALAVAKALGGFSALSSLGLNGNMFSAARLAELRAVLAANGHAAALGEEPFDENDESGDEDDEGSDGDE
jgi:Ran GTPase-activating protein 1